MAQAALPHRADAQPEPGSWLLLPSLFGLAPCGVYPATAITGCAVRSYRTISPLPLRGAALWTSPSGVPGCPPKGGVAEAVCFLWHWPSTGLDARVPDVIRHTALRSSDFPLPSTPARAKASGSDRPVLLPVDSVARIMKPRIVRKGLASNLCNSRRLCGNARRFIQHLDHLSSGVHSKSIITIRLHPQRDLKASGEGLLI